MKVIEETFVKGQSRKEVITVGKKKFIRIASSSGVDWRRYKTNHQVNQSEFESLEQEYKKSFPNDFTPDSHFNGINMHSIGNTISHQFAGIIEDDKERRRIERGLVEASKDGTNLLMGVKYVKEQTGWGLREAKEQTGWGLREAKDFVDDFFKRSKAFNR